MLEIERPKIECVEQNEEKTYAKFVMEPLERRGFGTTLGNSIRRVLAVLSAGRRRHQRKDRRCVLHEFATIPGVKEDVINIVLNSKKPVREVAYGCRENGHP